MESRSESVEDAYNATFELIFTTTSENERSSEFVKFLEGEESLYWVTGKPGSGKSTLMKFIKDEPQTSEHLKVWAGSKKLYMTGFYFWCSGGNEIQMTQKGLRTLIREALRNFLHVAPLIFPERFKTFVLFGDEIVWQEPFTLKELLSAFKLFVYEATKSHKIFLLVDGLDEFDGSFSKQSKLIESIQSLLTTDVKVCVSSRPWNVFQDAFCTRSYLRLEDLTYGDIRHYCSSNLSKNLGFAALQTSDPRSASNLIETVSTKACGVFLWVTLVVQSLLEGLTDGERLSDLQRRLDSLPSDLETLFWRILHSVDFERISQLLQIVRAAPYPLTILFLSYADEDDPNFVFNLPTRPVPDTIISSSVALMRRRLNACSKGLLEPQVGGNPKEDPGPQATVGYLHRTVKDFIQKSDIWDKLLDATDPLFNPALRLCVSHISYLKILPVNAVGCTNDESSYDYINSNLLKFWVIVVHCTWVILTHSPEELKLRFFEEVRGAVDEIVRRGFSSRESNFTRIDYSHCASTLSGTTEIRSFFHLAVKLQIWKYVDTYISSIQGPERVQELSLCLRTSVTDFILTYEGFQVKEPCIAIVKKLFEEGATLDADSWQHVLKNSAHRSDLLILLLRRGADPFDVRIRFSGEFLDTDLFEPEVLELAKEKREEAVRDGHKPWSVETADVAMIDDSGGLGEFTGYY
jgi:hypothetical protein